MCYLNDKIKYILNFLTVRLARNEKLLILVIKLTFILILHTLILNILVIITGYIIF